MGIVWNKTPLVLMNYLVSRPKTTSFLFVGFKLCKVHPCYQKQPGGIIWNKTTLILVNYPVVIFPPYTTACFLDNTVGCKLCVTHQLLYQKQPVGIILNKIRLVLMGCPVVRLE